MIRKLAVTAAILVASTASAQSLGLDLSTTPAKTKKTEQASPPAQTSQATSQTEGQSAASSSTGTSNDEGATVSASTASKEDLGPQTPSLGPEQIIETDRVKSIQRKPYLKAHRFELAPFISYSVNDAFYTKLGGALRLTYYLADTLGISVRAGLYQVLPTDDVRLAKRSFHSRIFYSVPQWSGMVDFEWAPIYGKVTIFNSILQLDAYLMGGAGVMHTETSASNGLSPAVDLGLGIRFMVFDYMAVNAAVVDTAYVDQPAGTTQSNTQNLISLDAGISFFFPFHSTGRAPE